MLSSESHDFIYLYGSCLLLWRFIVNLVLGCMSSLLNTKVLLIFIFRHEIVCRFFVTSKILSSVINVLSWLSLYIFCNYLFFIVDNNGSNWASSKTSATCFGATAVPEFNTPNGPFAMSKSSPRLPIGHHSAPRIIPVYAVVGWPGREFRRSSKVWYSCQFILFCKETTYWDLEMTDLKPAEDDPT